MGLKLHIHQTHHSIGDFNAAIQYVKDNVPKKGDGLHIFPELYLTGYPLQDLCLQQPFIDSYLVALELLNKWAKNEWKGNGVLLLGGLKYHFKENDLANKIENVVYSLSPGKNLEVIYTKRLLPNYDIFDEKKYFTEGTENIIYEYEGYKIAPLICEDMWPSNHYKVNPTLELYNIAKEPIDVVINFSASPFHVGKLKKRINRGKEISKLINSPFVYVNKVGAEDEILFDGASFVIQNQEMIKLGKMFEKDYLEYEIEKNSELPIKNDNKRTSHTWESLFNPNIEGKELSKLSDEELDSILQAIKFGIQDYAQKCGFNKFLVACSGGIDSALALVLVHLSLKEGQDLEAIYMPSLYSSSQSRELSESLCQNLGVALKHFPIKFIHSSLRTAFTDNLSKPLEGLADENIQSRLRGMLIYTRSNQTNAMVINTSNKSELAVGYSTQYGDSVGAISILGDLFKIEVYQLAQYINHHYGHIIPDEIITRPPTAELRENQVDSQSLPPYEELDPILEGLLSYRLSPSDLVDMGFSIDDVKKVFNLYQKAEYKRYQFCPILKLKSKSFGFGYRVPICKTTREYI